MLAGPVQLIPSQPQYTAANNRISVKHDFADSGPEHAREHETVVLHLCGPNNDK